MTMGGSLVVSLPWSWLNYHDVKAGDKVEVITRGRVAEIKLLNNERDGNERDSKDFE